ncbi:uncharacterized protein LOC143320922 [Chaetodon auriga]|uniref:uncharacterized protein LOC143320922 n=1 Tax=Chaetodon auriga TaxID=39042 RepID=UPI004032A40B
MPIASGAAGRVDVGVDTSTTWTPDGLKKKTKPANRNCDSYLQRYHEQKKKNNLLQGMQDNTEPSDREIEGAKEGNPQGNGSSEDLTTRKPTNGERSKKSLLCVLL